MSTKYIIPAPLVGWPSCPGYFTNALGRVVRECKPGDVIEVAGISEARVAETWLLRKRGIIGVRVVTTNRMWAT